MSKCMINDNMDNLLIIVFIFMLYVLTDDYIVVLIVTLIYLYILYTKNNKFTNKNDKIEHFENIYNNDTVLSKKTRQYKSYEESDKENQIKQMFNDDYIYNNNNNRTFITYPSSCSNYSFTTGAKHNLISPNDAIL